MTEFNPAVLLNIWSAVSLLSFSFDTMDSAASWGWEISVDSCLRTFLESPGLRRGHGDGHGHGLGHGHKHGTDIYTDMDTDMDTDIDIGMDTHRDIRHGHKQTPGMDMDIRIVQNFSLLHSDTHKKHLCTIFL